MGKERERINAGRRRQSFTKEFKLEAVRLLELAQKPAAQLALELGIRRNMLHDIIKGARLDLFEVFCLP